MAADSTTRLITNRIARKPAMNFSQVVHSIRQMESPPMTTALVGVTRFTSPLAAQKIMIITSGRKPSSAASPPKVGMDTAASPEVEGIRTVSPN